MYVCMYTYIIQTNIHTYIQENDAKTARAEKKAAEEIKSREQKEREILELTVEVCACVHVCMCV